MSVPTESLPPEDTRTIFSTLPGQFPHVNLNEKIKTQQFLDASNGVVILIEKFGKVFAPVLYDLNGNIRKIQRKFDENRASYEFIEDMLLVQKESGDFITIDAMQWLRRGLHMISRFFQFILENSDNRDNEDMCVLIKRAYKETLEQYHGWLGGQLFSILSKFTPNRRHVFYVFALEHHDKEEHVTRDLRDFTQNMSVCVSRLIEFYRQHELETTDRV